MAWRGFGRINPNSQNIGPNNPTQSFKDVPIPVRNFSLCFFLFCFSSFPPLPRHPTQRGPPSISWHIIFHGGTFVVRAWVDIVVEKEQSIHLVNPYQSCADAAEDFPAHRRGVHFKHRAVLTHPSILRSFPPSTYHSPFRMRESWRLVVWKQNRCQRGAPQHTKTQPRP